MAQLRYGGREILEEDILYIRTLIEQYPKESRRKLSVRVCEAWQWQQANGALRDMVCRGMLLMLERVRRTVREPLFNSLMEEHHYLGYEQPVGEHLKYLVWAEGRPIACLAWSSAPRHLGSRDRYIGWDAAARRSR